MKILVIEDDPGVAGFLKDGLSADLHSVDVADNGADGSFLARSYKYDAFILDYSLPRKDGLTLCKEFRTFGITSPIIFLSVNGDTATKVAALESGADDYMTKPFSLEELRARIKSISRRPQIIKENNILKAGDLTLNTHTNIVTRGSKNISVTRKEFCLLEYMLRNKGIILSRGLIMEYVWSADSDPLSNTVEAHIRNLRKKLNTGGKTNLIKNVPGRGYIIQ